MTLAVLGAIEAEIQQLRDSLENAQTRRVFHLDITTGSLHGQPVMVALCGVGKVNAAMASLAMAQAGARQLIFIGVAGALDPDLLVGDLVVATDLVQHDVDLTALKLPAGQILGEPVGWASNEAMRTALAAACRRVVASAGGHRTVVLGRIASGDQFLHTPAATDRVLQQFGAECVEMEGAAVAQACSAIGLPFAVVRIISDTADHAAADDFSASLDMVQNDSLAIVSEYIGALRR